MISLSRHLAVASLAAIAFVVGCASHSDYEAKHLADGTLRLKCQGALPACLSHAETACHGNNYEVLKARDQRDLYGPEYGTAHVEVRSSEAIVRCNAKGQAAPPLPPEAEPPPEQIVTAAPPVQPQAAQRSCIPGSTQACIGPGRCEGGQSCLPDGSAFGPCDCGTLGPPPVAPNAAPGASASASPNANTAAPTSIAPAAPGAAAPAKPPPPAGPAKPLKK